MAKVTFDTHTEKAFNLFLEFYGIKDAFYKNRTSGLLDINDGLIAGAFLWAGTHEGAAYWARYDSLWKQFYNSGTIDINTGDYIFIDGIEHIISKADKRFYLRAVGSDDNSLIFRKLGLDPFDFGEYPSRSCFFPWQDSLDQLTETVCKLLDEWYKVMPDNDFTEKIISKSIGVNSREEIKKELSSSIIIDKPYKHVVTLPWWEVETPFTPEEAINPTDSFIYKPTKQTFKL